MDTRAKDTPLTASENVEVKLSRTKTWGGLETKECYGPADIGDMDYARDLGNPGEFPYTRGAYPRMYRSKMWTQRAMFGYGAPEDTREGIEKAVAAGLSGINIVVDPVSQQVLDPDHPAFGPEVGLDGASIPCVRDAERLLEGIDLTKVDVAWHWGPMAYPIVAAVAIKRGLPQKDMQGSHMPDLLQQTISGWGERLLPANFAHRMTADSIEYVVKHSPRWAMGVPQGYDIRERGLTPPGEIAVGMAIVICVVDELIARGMHIDEIAPHLAWVSISDVDFFEEIAKFRALRRFWAHTMKDRYGALDPKSMRMRMACHTSGRSLVYRQPLNNLARVAIQSVAALLGGVQSLDCCTFDEPIGIPTHEARELAIRTQQIVANEIGVARTADPLGGSYYIETLTNQVEAAARDMLAKIEEIGILKAIREGHVERLTDEHNLQIERELDNQERVVIGLNKFLPELEPVPLRFEFDPTNTKKHIQHLIDLKKTRDAAIWRERLRELHRVTRAGSNSHQAMIDALLADASIGEVWGTLRLANGLSYDAYDVIQSPLDFN
jgi:methylmalonyl-CoA mutase N-terminal domain/subunit